MKKLFYILLILVFCSCEKNYPLIDCNVQYPTTQDTTSITEVEFLEGDWLLMNGRMFMENLDLNTSSTQYHFSNGPTSSLRYGGPLYSFEPIVRYETTWSFEFPSAVPGVGEFILNYDSLTPYGLNVHNTYLTIIEPVNGNQLLLGGSSRPITIKKIDYDNKIIKLIVQEAYQQINDYDYRYYSILTFKKIN